ncbi:MAG: osmotically inducible protein OsmC [Chloroflexi bacterium RBG_13_48_10]|nr:MAG: osmotically inducible protein OsmC [Chloroflexi bacterium RBG_13_48_10]
MEMLIDFPGGDRVDAHFGPFTVMTDQPNKSGDLGSAPAPFSLFLASIATCAGIYVLGFCRQRNLPTEGMRIIQRSNRNSQTGMVESVDIEIQTPPNFPEKYLPSLVRSAELCAVKKHLEKPPVFNVFTQPVASAEVQ